MQLTAQEIIDARNAQLREMLDESHNDLVTNLKWASETLSLPRVLESLFINSFLPFLNGTRQPTAEDNLTLNWTRLNIYPTSPFVVVDNMGRDLFVMPALYDTSTIATMSQSLGSKLDGFVNNYKTYSAHGQGNAFFNRNANTILKALDAGVNKETLTAIRDILKRYEAFSQNTADTKVAATAAPAAGGLMIEYD